MKSFVAFAASVALLLALVHFLPDPARAQFTPPAVPRTYTDIATPSANPPAGATTLYTKAGTVCGLSPSGTETCTGSGGGTTVTVAAPYVTIGGTKYVAATLWPFTAFFSGSFLDGQTASLTAGANGSELMSYPGGTNTASWYSVAATTSIEMEFQGTTSLNSNASQGYIGVWLCDNTNGKVYDVVLLGNASPATVWFFASWTLAGCTGTPSAQSTIGQFEVITNGIGHVKLAKTGSNLQALVSYDSGQTYTQLGANQSVGTLTKGGILLQQSGAANTIVNATILSVAVN